MYDFAVVALLGLALVKVVDLVLEYVPSLGRIATLLTVALGVGATVALDYSVFRGFDIAIRESWMGIWATGFAVAGMTSVWRTVLAWFGATQLPSADSRPSRPRIAA